MSRPFKPEIEISTILEVDLFKLLLLVDLSVIKILDFCPALQVYL